jgi:hypothetical protein
MKNYFRPTNNRNVYERCDFIGAGLPENDIRAQACLRTNGPVEAVHSRLKIGQKSMSHTEPQFFVQLATFSQQEGQRVRAGTTFDSPSTFQHLADFEKDVINLGYAYADLLLSSRPSAIPLLLGNKEQYIFHIETVENDRLKLTAIDQDRCDALFKEENICGEYVASYLDSGEIVRVPGHPDDLSCTVKSECTCVKHRQGHQCIHIFIIFFLYVRGSSNQTCLRTHYSSKDTGIRLSNIDGALVSEYKSCILKNQMKHSTDEDELIAFETKIKENVALGRMEQLNAPIDILMTESVVTDTSRVRVPGVHRLEDPEEILEDPVETSQPDGKRPRTASVLSDAEPKPGRPRGSRNKPK